MSSIYKGIVKFYDIGKQYGFIIEISTGIEYFVHNTGLIDRIVFGNKVTFEIEESSKGLRAVNVRLTDINSLISNI
jgi:cold shock protein